MEIKRKSPLNIMENYISLYFINLKYSHLTPIFRLHNIHLVLSTCPHKYKWLLCTSKTEFSRFSKIKKTLICSEKTINTYLKAKNSLYTTQISSFKYVFIIFSQKNQMLKYTLKFSL